MRVYHYRGLAVLVALVTLALTSTAVQADTLQQGGSIRPVQKIWMSDKPNGEPLSVFPSGAQTVYVVFDYKDAADAEIQVRVVNPKGDTIFTETKKYSGAGRENLEVKSSDPMPDGGFVTNVYVGLSGNLFLSESNEWNVGKAPPPPAVPTGAPLPAPNQAAAPKAAQPGQAPAAVPQAPANQPAPPAPPSVVNTDPGVSLPMLIGAGVLIVGLLALVVWAVRGFMSAPKASS